MSAPELYHHGMSVCASKVRMALAEKGVTWTGRYIDIRRGESHTPEYLKINPKGVVPTMVHNGNIIRESTVICEYVNDAFEGPALIPDEPYQRAMMRLWTRRLDDGLHYPCTAALTFLIAQRAGLANSVSRFSHGLEMITADVETIADAKLAELVEKTGISIGMVCAALSAFDKLIADMNLALQDRRWLCGDGLSLADLSYAPYITRLENLNMDWLWKDRPCFGEWYQRIQSRPTYQNEIIDWLDENELPIITENGKVLREVIQQLYVEYNYH